MVSKEDICKGIRTPHKHTDDFVVIAVVIVYMFQSISEPVQFGINGVPDWGFALALVHAFGKKTVAGFKEFWNTIQEREKENRKDTVRELMLEMENK